MKKGLFFAISTAILLTGCSKFGKITDKDFAVTPTPLEYVAGEVPATISANIPAKFMPKNAVITCTPVLRWEGGEAKGASATFQGEKVEGNNTIISNKNGGHISMRTSFPFERGMEKSDLYMQFNAKKGSKSVDIPEVKIGYGVLSTAELVTACAKNCGQSLAQDNFQRVINQKQEAAIKFLIGQANLRGSELNSQNVQEFIAKLKEIKSDEESLILNNIEISAYASPDGKYSFNEKLAAKRGDVSEAYVGKELKKQNLDADVETKYTAEDWDGFQALVSASNLQDKEVILRVLSMYEDPEQREQEIKNIAVVYKELADAVLPELRRARMVINYDVIGRSDEQILAQFDADASKLSIEELIYAANVLATTDAQKEAINKKAIALYPNDYRAYNNLAVLAMKQGNQDAAKNYIQQASAKSASAPEPNINLGTIAIQNGDFKAAENYIAKGASAKNADEALGNLYVAQGKYNQAAAKLSKSASNSAALAQILSQNYADAAKTLEGIKTPDALTYYLKAVLGARQEKTATVEENLKKAVSLDASYKQKAQSDIEFANYASVVNAL